MRRNVDAKQWYNTAVTNPMWAGRSVATVVLIKHNNSLLHGKGCIGLLTLDKYICYFLSSQNTIQSYNSGTFSDTKTRMKVRMLVIESK